MVYFQSDVCLEILNTHQISVFPRPVSFSMLTAYCKECRDDSFNRWRLGRGRNWNQKTSFSDTKT